MSKFSSSDINNYIQFFSEAQRDSVVKALIDEDILKRALDTKEGQIILSGIVDNIQKNTMKIISLCAEGLNADASKLLNAGFEINYGYGLMKEWAKTIMLGEHHTEKMLHK